MGTNWGVIYEDGDMKVYRRELEEGGVVVDPLKSFYTAAVRRDTSYYVLPTSARVKMCDFVLRLLQNSLMFGLSES